MQPSLLLLTILLTGATAYSQPRYPASTIPDSMKRNAHVVVRENTVEFEVKSIDKAAYRVHRVVTILDQGGEDDLFFVEYTDRFVQLEGIEITVYDANGTPLNRYKKKDLGVDNAGEGLIEDGKVYYKKVGGAGYPVTVAFDYELKYNGLLDYPDYEIITAEESIEQSSCTVKVPVELDLRYKARHTGIKPTIANDGKVITYQWQTGHLPALRYEAGSVGRRNRYPGIMISPNKFKLDGYTGDMSSWGNFGQWYGQLSANAINLDEGRKDFFREMVKNEPNAKEKTRKIYDYLQKNFRYVSIQLGIGGFKPFTASFVDQKKYGDCKALSNYVQACLDAVGIKSYQALINAGYGEAPVDSDFPQNSFNHVILCVPLDRDSVWLECTSRTNEFGVLGSFTENRNALLITPQGGVMVATPKSRATDNTFSSYARITLNEDATGTATIILHTKGEYKETLFETGLNSTRDGKKKYLVSYLGYQQPDQFEITGDKNTGTASVTMGFEKVPEFTAGSKMFLNPRLYSIALNNLPDNENRTQDYYFAYPFIKTDTTIYVLPPGYTTETLPKDRIIASEHGGFITSCRYDEQAGTITTTAKIELKNHRIPAARFEATRLFVNEVIKEYTEKIVIRKK